MLSLRFPAHHLPILSTSTGSKLSLALIEIGHSCAFDGAYVDQHVDAAFVRLDGTTALTDVEPPPYGSICHSWPSAHQATSPQGHSARMIVDHLRCGARPRHRKSSPANHFLKTADSPAEV